MRFVFKTFLLSLLLSAPQACREQKASVTVKFTNPDGSSSPQITAEVADTPAAQELGLMYRKALEPTAGMLFIFSEEKPRTFWMKNTYLELDMIFIDEDRTVVSIVEKAVPLTETARPSEKPAKYVLEVRGGNASSWHIVPGSRTEITDTAAKTR